MGRSSSTSSIICPSFSWVLCTFAVIFPLSFSVVLVVVCVSPSLIINPNIHCWRMCCCRFWVVTGRGGRWWRGRRGGRGRRRRRNDFLGFLSLFSLSSMFLYLFMTFLHLFLHIFHPRLPLFFTLFDRILEVLFKLIKVKLFRLSWSKHHRFELIIQLLHDRRLSLFENLANIKILRFLIFVNLIIILDNLAIFDM